MAAATTLHRLNPDMAFCYVSGAGTDSSEKGRSMWARVKGKTENDLLKLFSRAYMFRPGYIHPERGAVSRTPWVRVAGMVLLAGRLSTDEVSVRRDDDRHPGPRDDRGGPPRRPREHREHPRHQRAGRRSGASARLIVRVGTVLAAGRFEGELTTDDHRRPIAGRQIGGGRLDLKPKRPDARYMRRADRGLSVFERKVRVARFGVAALSPRSDSGPQPHPLVTASLRKRARPRTSWR